MEKISLIIPTLDEEENLPHVLEYLPDFHEIIVVDGHSSDKTVKIAQEYGAKVIFDNVGKGSALIKGMKEAAGDIIIMMDADCSHCPSELEVMVSSLRAGYDLCMGSRFMQGGGTEDMPFHRKIGNRFFVFLVNMLFRSNYSDLCYGYRGIQRSAIECLGLSTEGFAIETQMSIRAAKNKLKIIEVPSFEKKRKKGMAKLRSFRHGFEILKTIVYEAIN